MSTSDGFQSYTNIIAPLAFTSFAVSAAGGVIGIVLMFIFFPMFVKKIVNCSLALYDAGHMFRESALVPVHYGSMASLKGGLPECQIFTDYLGEANERKRLVGSIFGIDKVSKDFIKLYDSESLYQSKTK